MPARPPAPRIGQQRRRKPIRDPRCRLSAQPPGLMALPTAGRIPAAVTRRPTPPRSAASSPLPGAPTRTACRLSPSHDAHPDRQAPPGSANTLGTAAGRYPLLAARTSLNPCPPKGEKSSPGVRGSQSQTEPGRHRLRRAQPHSVPRGHRRIQQRGRRALPRLRSRPRQTHHPAAGRDGRSVPPFVCRRTPFSERVPCWHVGRPARWRGWMRSLSAA